MSLPKNEDKSQCQQPMETSASSEPIPFSGKLTVSDAYDAISLAQPLGNKIANWVVYAFLLLALLYTSWLTAYSYLQGEKILGRMALSGVVLFLFPCLFVIAHKTWYRKRAKQLYKDGKRLYSLTIGEVDDISLRSKTEDGEGTLNWSAFCGYRESESVAVLYQHYPVPYVIMARSKFSTEQDWENCIQLVSKKLKRL